MDLSEIKSKSVGLVLSGGGVKGMAHIGMIQALNEFGISTRAVSGTSVGALVGALYANGNTVAEMLQFFKETPLFRYHFVTILKPGLLDTDRYFDLLARYFPGNAFESLQRKLYVVATDLQKGDEKIFSKGELIKPLLASAALPPVFSPVAINGRLYADGGIMNNFPYDEVALTSDFVIGSNVSGIKEIPKEGIKSSLQLANRTTSLMIYAINRNKVNKCDLLFEPKALELIGILDKKGIEKAYTIGYEHAVRVMEQVFKQT
ncbi:patatin-like phospholipase family protein [Arenibacter sp. M-2]|uniref:patatin-like phospholipase family protein n=1 Tax=unclassified Arenibacter TaxID=2615047 RepID=UPI000D75B28C|nr:MULTISPECIES: patatin-like phospholipase family protein [unclassified Arenibacter]MDL5510234.1 patatin-like phospholipase family protein [Arenibacter sp. M-2]PXX27800.1 NTE family protein [Arenibacter sp. ARW7G5Y1]|tara:strand:- start:7276 stop:8061 length:786 start_codon:yes stop_codon:yes gene_type:complete